MGRECARCQSTECYEGKDCYGLATEARRAYDEDELDSMRVSGEIEAEHYMKLTRLEEIMLHAEKTGKRRLGIAFCVGLHKEACTLDRILASRGFEVYSACCKICGIDKAELGVTKMHGKNGKEAVCNPIGQAMLLNRQKTDINVIVGLCVGHDMIFTEHSDAPVTTLIVKDRVLSHNPVGAIYSSYYLEKKFGLTEDR